MSLLLNKRIDALILVGSTYAGEGGDDRKADYVRNAAKTVPVFMINGYIKGNMYIVPSATITVPPMMWLPDD